MHTHTHKHKHTGEASHMRDYPEATMGQPEKPFVFMLEKPLGNIKRSLKSSHFHDMSVLCVMKQTEADLSDAMLQPV